MFMSSEDRLVLAGRVPRRFRGRVQSSQPEYDLYYVRMQRVWHPPTDVYQTDTVVVVKVEIAGMDEEELNISFADRRLVISGNRVDPAAYGAATNHEVPNETLPNGEARVTYHNMEIHYGEFRSEVQINMPIDEAAISANYRDGFLYVTLAKPKTHHVSIGVSTDSNPNA
jgi:HSP20 family molecular chaperone IbpA